MGSADGVYVDPFKAKGASECAGSSVPGDATEIRFLEEKGFGTSLGSFRQDVIHMNLKGVSNDDLIVDLCLFLREKRQQNVLVISQDNNLCTTAESQGLRATMHETRSSSSLLQESPH